MNGDSRTDPPNTSEEAALKRARTVANALDEAFEIPVINYKVGLDPLLGLLPVSGDAASGAISLYIVAEAARMGVPPKKLLRMMANVGVDTAVGSIPVAGTLFDSVWKANMWNIELMEEHLDSRDSPGESFSIPVTED